MENKILDGKLVAKYLQGKQETALQILKEKGIQPKLSVILVGEDPASKVYVRFKEKACEKIGIISETICLNAATTQETLLKIIATHNEDSATHGILVQLPLPEQINEQEVILHINPLKDVDCFHPQNVGLLVGGAPYVLPCTPAGIMEILKYYHISTQGKNIVVAGRSNIVGKPMANLLMQKNDFADATVTIVHSRTKDIPFYTKHADIVIAAIGRPHFFKLKHFKKDSVIIDVGMNRVAADNEKGYKLVGDVDFEDVLETVSKITPVPGGVGPMTIAMLMQNTLIAAARQTGITISDGFLA